MAFSLVGLIWMAVKNVVNGWVILFVFGVTAYLCASWGQWWFGGAYGHRPFIDFFGLLAIPMAYTISLLLAKNIFIKNSVLVLVLLLLFTSVRLNMIYSWPWEGNWGWENVLEKYEQALFLDKVIK